MQLLCTGLNVSQSVLILWDGLDGVSSQWPVSNISCISFKLLQLVFSSAGARTNPLDVTARPLRPLRLHTPKHTRVNIHCLFSSISCVYQE